MNNYNHHVFETFNIFELEFSHFKNSRQNVRFPKQQGKRLKCLISGSITTAAILSLLLSLLCSFALQSVVADEEKQESVASFRPDLATKMQ